MQSLFINSSTSSHKILVRWWKNAQANPIPSNGTLFLLHGMGEYSLRYREFASFLTQWGFDVLSFDHPGYGMTAKEGGYKANATFGEMIEEANGVLNFWFREGPNSNSDLASAPLIFMGHSMGALILLSWMTRSQPIDDKLRPQKLVVSSPPLGLRLKVPEWKDKVAQILYRFAPNLPLGSEISPDFLSADRVSNYSFAQDPYHVSTASAKLYISLKESIQEVNDNSSKLKVPSLCFVGSDDPIVSPDAFKQYFEKLSIEKKFIEHHGMKHECLNEIGREKVFQEVLSWILA